MSSACRYALSLLGAGSLDKALDVILPAIQAHPRHAGMRMCCGVICYEKGRLILEGDS